MILLSLVSYIADVAIIGTYFLLARTGKVRAFHWSNALGCFPLIAGELIVHAYPVLPVTTFFGIAGWYGLWVERRKTKQAERYRTLYDTGASINGIRVVTSEYIPKGKMFVLDPKSMSPTFVVKNLEQLKGSHDRLR